jgi:hypothetical protein
VGCGDVKNGKHYELLFERRVSDQKVSHEMKNAAAARSNRDGCGPVEGARKRPWMVA